jgi:PilZ domain
MITLLPPPVVSTETDPGPIAVADGHAPRPARKRTYLKGLLIYGDSHFTLDCAIQDLSDGGAKIILNKNQALSAEVYLIVVKQGVVHKATVVWQKYPARGLKFTETYPLEGPLPTGLQFLRRLWVDLCARPGIPGGEYERTSVRR